MLRFAAVAVLLAAACSSNRAAPPRAASSATPVPTPSAAPCRYAFPVRPQGSVRYGRVHHDYPATDILAPRGSDVVSPSDGTVDWVSRTDPWVPRVDDPATRGGLSVAVVGDDGVRYYGSHMLDVSDGLEPGVRVEAGRLLGHVGTSGNARGTEPHLHFGISRPTEPHDWRVRRGEIPPFEYLNAWRDGRHVTPAVPGAPDPVCVVRPG